MGYVRALFDQLCLVILKGGFMRLWRQSTCETTSALRFSRSSSRAQSRGMPPDPQALETDVSFMLTVVLFTCRSD